MFIGGSQELLATIAALLLVFETGEMVCDA